MLRTAAREAFYDHTVRKEGRVPLMYADILGLVTTVMGNLIDASQSGNPEPWRPALKLPWQRPNGTPATPNEIRDAWLTVKNGCCGVYSNPRRCEWKARGKGLCFAHAGWKAAAKATTIRLSEEAMDRIFWEKVGEMWGYLVARFPNLEAECADAQMGVLSFAWAMGPAFKWTNLSRAIAAGAWDIAAVECKIREDNNPGIVSRNQANRILFRNAAQVKARGLDPDVLYYPADIASATPTQPQIENPPSEPEVGGGESFGARRAMLSEAIGKMARDDE